ncbi:hypothetical protein HF521_002987 [Silurus meridionalis]|uniref:Abhydrolase domain containing 15a n=1 Tax=Silurus meridionalis TaxID=175797 RepID=A0A8T0B490_SILME|nr:hypothetical protein HF521_002987 [Silurus meridionalis]
MLEWIGAVCVLLLVATVWPVLKHLGSFFRGPEIALGNRSAPECAAGTEPGKVHEAAGESSSSSSSASAPVALICKPSALAKYLLKHCVSFCKYVPYPAWHWRTSSCLQTVWGALWPHDCAVHFIRDYLQLSDDGLVALDWAVVGPKRRRTSSNSSSPILLIIPNSFGKLTRNVLTLCEAALSHGYLPVVFNRRSQNGTPLSTIKLQEFGDPADLREAVRYIRYRQPVGRLYAVSESTGSGLLLSYLGECGSSSYMTAAACLSPIFAVRAGLRAVPVGPSTGSSYSIRRSALAGTEQCWGSWSISTACSPAARSGPWKKHCSVSLV